MDEKEMLIKYYDELNDNRLSVNIDDIISSEFESNERKIIRFDLSEKDSFKMGESRIFTPYIDMPEDIEMPFNLDFVGQLNMAEISKYDDTNLLPKNGHLYFFQTPGYYLDKYYDDFCKVIYTEDDNLVRKEAVVCHAAGDDLNLNLGISNIRNEIENFNKRYYMYNEELEYSSFYSEEYNKIFGFYTNCQLLEDDIKKISKKYIILLQIGSELYGEGVTTFLISEEDLKNKRFENVIYTYAQS